MRAGPTPYVAVVAAAAGLRAAQRTDAHIALRVLSALHGRVRPTGVNVRTPARVSPGVAAVPSTLVPLRRVTPVVLVEGAIEVKPL